MKIDLPFDEPKPILKAGESPSETVHGWDFNEHRNWEHVYEVWRRYEISYPYNPDTTPYSERRSSGSQCQHALYASKDDALKALAYAWKRSMEARYEKVVGSELD